MKRGVQIAEAASSLRAELQREGTHLGKELQKAAGAHFEFWGEIEKLHSLDRDSGAVNNGACQKISLEARSQQAENNAS